MQRPNNDYLSISSRASLQMKDAATLVPSVICDENAA
jgi:hypothetical protein